MLDWLEIYISLLSNRKYAAGGSCAVPSPASGHGQRAGEETGK